MFSRRRHRVSLFDPRLGDYACVRGRNQGYNVRAAWGEAAAFVIRELRMGRHPDLLELEIESELLQNTSSEYLTLCLRYSLRMLRNMRNARQFNGLPTYTEFEQLNLVQGRRARFEMMMYERFRDFGVTDRFGGDIDIAREIARARALDRDVEDELVRMRERDRFRVDEQYRANEETLRAELQDAQLRAEAAEGRLQFERQQRRMGGIPAGYGVDPTPYVRFAPAGPQMVEPYAAGMNGPNQYDEYIYNQIPGPYAADMNGRNQYDGYGVNEMPYEDRRDYQPQRQRRYRPDPYPQSQYNIDWQNPRGNRIGYASTLNLDDWDYGERR